MQWIRVLPPICLPKQQKEARFIWGVDGYVFDKSIDMEVDGESPDYMDEDPRVLMLKKEGTHWELAAIIEATTELKN